jgi:hypothetical protein
VAACEQGWHAVPGAWGPGGFAWPLLPIEVTAHGSPDTDHRAAVLRGLLAESGHVRLALACGMCFDFGDTRRFVAGAAVRFLDFRKAGYLEPTCGDVTEVGAHGAVGGP